MENPSGLYLYNKVIKSSAGVSDWIKTGLGSRSFIPPYTLCVEITGNLILSVECQIDPSLPNTSLIVLPLFEAMTQSQSSAIRSPFCGFRLNITSYTSGSAILSLAEVFR